ncbi:MAG TPA: DUF1015 family protein [Chitinophagales bacterium]|nr:DUF1015 family protein [Chitinophagales bacterium]
MITIKPFKGYRPLAEFVKLVASRPYDVMNRQEAKEEAKGNPYSFLHVIRAEIDLPDDVDEHDNQVYEKARDNFRAQLDAGIFFQDEKSMLYVYELEMNEQLQTGLVACSSVEDYFADRIKKHEHTRPAKEMDRIRHMKLTRIHSEPVFLAYRDVQEVNELTERITQSKNPVYDFEADDGVRHRFWVLDDEKHTIKLTKIFKEKVPCTYIADGHHRAASAAKVGKGMAEENPNHSGEEEYNFFLSVLFPASQLRIMDYNRLVKDLNGYDVEKFLQKVSVNFAVQPVPDELAKPRHPHEFGMYLEGKWYKLTPREGTCRHDPIGVLDVTILQENLLAPVLGVNDPRTDERIDFVGGIRGLKDLKQRVDSGEMKVAFALYPVTMEQLMEIADAGSVMPPKSTWFEPKLRSGMVVHWF